MALYRMINSIQTYAWGSTSMLAHIQRRAPGTTPQAELWMGTHPAAPSRLEVAGEVRSLADHLAAEESTPGAREDAVPGLPFLFKIITVARGLSIQAHPDREQAERGFAREEAARIPRTDPSRTYRDRNHKPELVCALSEFTGLAGFRPEGELVREMERFREFMIGRGRPARLEGLLTAMERYVRDAGDGTWRALFMELLRAGENADPRAELVAAGAAYAVRAARAAGAAGAARYRCVATLLEQYPGDPGALAPLYLNLFHLRTGEALFLGPGVLHAYLGGAAVEIMASSDNVVRAGCTVKHVDPRELAEILRYERYPLELVSPVAPEERPGIRVYRSPAEEFELTHLSRSGQAFKDEGPAIVLNAGDPAACSTGTAELTFGPGESLFVDHRSRSFEVRPQVPGNDLSLYVAALPGALR